ncbi:cell division protein FtsX [Spirosoma utsteinense]|uniref:Cell division protein FtsX n=1 Tax=Spirosoma utsteinense TaxID=2585773 RepID=A0ABR6W2A7_9BACT|nr:permease-like cell division protein FtsX [Spirosoma utsteinense]MBC3786002.1 cell division transport system permease protein [Spirosoma utsteinense]MBC3790700.1 cell division transport system permease protein [Spirosoma utsteinense]
MARTKKKVGTYPSGMILFSLTLALFLIGFCGLLAIQSKRLVTFIRENYEMRVFLDKGLDEAKFKKLFKAIAERPYILTTAGGEPQISLVTKDVAAKEFIAETKEDFSKFLGENPLRDSYRIKLNEAYFEEAKLQGVKEDLEQIDGVFEVVYQENLVDSINRNITKIYIVMSAFAVVLLFIIIVLMNNTIRLALHSQRLLIRSMQLVGATNGFITKPFLGRGIMQGLIAGVIAVVLLLAALQIAIHNLPELESFQEPEKIAMLLAGILGLGVLIGFISTFQAVHRYLGLTLDELY